MEKMLESAATRGITKVMEARGQEFSDVLVEIKLGQN